MYAIRVAVFGILCSIVLSGSLVGQKAGADKKSLEAEGYGRWESLRGSGTLSPDGRWLAYSISRNSGKNELRLRMLVTEEKHAFAYGKRATFSEDSRWLGYLVGLSEAEQEKRKKAKKPARDRLVLRNLASGKSTEVKDVAAFSFSEHGQYVAMRRHASAGSKTKGGVDVVVRRLETGEEFCFGNVASHRWCEAAPLLALAIDTPDTVGNSVTLFNAETGSLRILDSAHARYRSLSWREKAADLAFLRETDSDKKKDEEPTHRIVAWRGLDGAGRKVTYDHRTDATFPSKMRVVDTGPRWHDEGDAVFFSIRKWERPPAAKKKDAEKSGGKKESVRSLAEFDEGVDKDKKRGPRTTGKAKPKSLRASLKKSAGVDVWHARDTNIIPRQKKTRSMDRRKSHLCALWLDDGRFVRLADDTVDRVSVFEGGAHGLGRDTTRHERVAMFGPRVFDAYLVDTRTGKRTRILEKHKFAYDAGPNGRHLAYVANDRWWVYDVESGERRDLTGALNAPFINDERAVLTDEKPPYGRAGWTQDGEHLLLYSRYDVWQVAVDGSEARRLTNGAEAKRRYRLLDLDRDEDHIDPKRPLYLSVFGDRDKQSGFARLAPGGKPETLLLADQRIGSLAKAKKADVYAWSAQSFSDSPDIFVAGPDLKRARQVTKTNPFHKDYRWGRSELVDYRSARGEPLQGALFYPAGWKPGRKYPMIVYIYEKRSQNLHAWYTPSERRPYDPAVFTTQGYFVYQPDIVYRPQNPGLSAVECVVPAVKAVLKRGLVDEKRVGLVGHSWGAYQTAFIVTQTDLFAAGIAGAPLTNMMSMSMNIYWNSGGTNARIFHESQGRMDRPFWRDVDTYIKNSPIFSIDNLRTPLLIAFGDKDGAVDWHQGIEMYNAARLAGKPLVMLVYAGENHGLRKKPNQVDYHWRIREWFAHYLKDADAPKWITKGTTVIEREDELAEKKRQAKRKGRKPKRDAEPGKKPESSKRRAL